MTRALTAPIFQPQRRNEIAFNKMKEQSLSAGSFLFFRRTIKQGRERTNTNSNPTNKFKWTGYLIILNRIPCPFSLIDLDQAPCQPNFYGLKTVRQTTAEFGALNTLLQLNLTKSNSLTWKRTFWSLKVWFQLAAFTFRQGARVIYTSSQSFLTKSIGSIWRNKKGRIE